MKPMLLIFCLVMLFAGIWNAPDDARIFMIMQSISETIPRWVVAPTIIAFFILAGLYGHTQERKRIKIHAKNKILIDARDAWKSGDPVILLESENEKLENWRKKYTDEEIKKNIKPYIYHDDPNRPPTGFVKFHQRIFEYLETNKKLDS